VGEKVEGEERGGEEASWGPLESRSSEMCRGFGAERAERREGSVEMRCMRMKPVMRERPT